MFPHKKVVVTGAAGFIGTHLVESLVDTGWDVLGIDLLDKGYDPALKHANLDQVRGNPHFHLEVLDIRDDPGVRACLGRHQPDVLVHLAARVGAATCMADPDLAWDVNVNGTRTVFRACQDFGVRMIHVSSAAVYSGKNLDVRRETDPLPPAPNSYVKSKQEAETLLFREADQLPVGTLILRLASTYGPRQRPGTGVGEFVNRLSRGETVCLFTDRAKTRDLIYVRDAVTAVMKSLEWNNHRIDLINIGSGKQTDMRDLVQIIASKLGVEPKIHMKPAPEAYENIPSLDTEKADRLLGFKAENSIERGIERLINWMKNNRLEGKHV